MSIPTPKIVRSMRRTITLQISRQGELIVKAPILIPDRLINNFINEKEDWILKALERVRSRIDKQKTYEEGEEFLYLGNIYKLHYGKFKDISIDKTLNYPEVLKFRIQKELTDWYIKQAREEITKQVKHYNQIMKTQYTTIRFSDTISKWGSCGPDNSLQFNWRLIMAPIRVINYVVIHELAHTVEKNHGSRFWRIVSLHTPAYKQHRKWLEKNKHLLTV